MFGVCRRPSGSSSASSTVRVEAAGTVTFAENVASPSETLVSKSESEPGAGVTSIRRWVSSASVPTKETPDPRRSISTVRSWCSRGEKKDGISKIWPKSGTSETESLVSRSDCVLFVSRTSTATPVSVSSRCLPSVHGRPSPRPVPTVGLASVVVTLSSSDSRPRRCQSSVPSMSISSAERYRWSDSYTPVSGVVGVTSPCASTTICRPESMTSAQSSGSIRRPPRGRGTLPLR